MRSERVYHDLTESTEFVELLETRFYFSSSFNKDRFLKGYENFIREEENKIISKYGVNLSIRFYLLIAYYLRIEKRGFYIKRFSTLTNNFDIVLDSVDSVLDSLNIIVGEK